MDFESYFSAHDEYQRLLLEYERAREAWKKDSSPENWEKFQEALRRLKRQAEIIEMNRMML